MIEPNVNEENLFDGDDDLNKDQEDDDPPTDGIITCTAPLLSIEDYKVFF
jgi:hypothetical protein